MRTKAFAVAALLTTGLAVSTLAACGSSDDTAASSGSSSSSTMHPSMSDSMTPSTSGSAAAMMTRTGTFTGANGKNVAGMVKVSDSDITLSGFSSDEGPDLHVYLTNGTDEAAVMAGKEISAVKYDEASQSFMVDGADLSSYTTVVIHCDKAHAVFGTATLS